MGTDSEMGRKGVGSFRKANDLQKRREAIEKQEANLERIQVNFIVVKWRNYKARKHNRCSGLDRRLTAERLWAQNTLDSNISKKWCYYQLHYKKTAEK